MKKYSAIILILIPFLFSCASKEEESLMQEEFIPAEESGTKFRTINRKLIKEADINFRTNDIEQASSQIKKLIENHDAYISQENSFEYRNKEGYNITIRVPKDNFDSLLAQILNTVKIKKLENKSIEIKDVTEEFLDIEIRLKVKKETELKYLDLLKHAKNLDETLKIEKLLSEIRVDIESIEGKRKFLEDKIQYSTIRVHVFESIKYSKRFFSDFWDALKDGWQIFLHVLTLLAYLWVVILAFFLTRYAYKRIKRELQKKK